MEETFEDCLVEFRVGATGEETVEFDKEEEVDVFGRGGFAMALADMVPLWKVDTLFYSVSILTWIFGGMGVGTIVNVRRVCDRSPKVNTRK